MAQVDAVENLLRTEFGGALGTRALDPNEDLIARGVIDSFGLISLIAALESAFGIEIVEEDVVPDHFQTLERIAAFVADKQSTLGSGQPSDVRAAD